jgi:hypothetical protein
MKNKKMLYGLIGLGALAGLYFWNKNKKSDTTEPISSEPNINIPKIDLISEGTKKINSYVQGLYQDGKNPKYTHNDYKDFFSALTDYGKTYLSLEQTIKKYAKNESEQNTIIEIWLWDISKQLSLNDFKLTNEGSLFLAKNPTIIDDIRGIKIKKTAQ